MSSPRGPQIPRLRHRDEAVLRLVIAHKQIQASHIRARLFDGLSHRPCERSIERLYQRRFIRRIGTRPGNEDGKRTGYIYSVATKGLRYFNIQGRQPKVKYKEHALSISDCMEIICLAGVPLPVFEPERRVTINGVQLAPDAWVNMGNPAVGYMLEVDIADIYDHATDYTPQLKDKMRRYWDAACSGSDGFPYVLFAARYPRRLAHIQRLIHSLPPEQQPLFKACLIQDICTAVTSAA